MDKRVLDSVHPMYQVPGYFTSLLEKNLDLIYKKCNFRMDVPYDVLAHRFINLKTIMESGLFKETHRFSLDLNVYRIFELCCKKFSRGIFNFSFFGRRINFKYNSNIVLSSIFYETIAIDNEGSSKITYSILGVLILVLILYKFIFSSF